ncbi:MAG: hypothetical protein HZC14_02575 [Candidatus Niyogibacteria bacterium]|nr:hypothetical protein [Candidatus Niyogibacteria bacterium]
MNLKQKLYKIFAVLFKNLLAFVAGGVLGLFAVALFAKPLLERVATKDVGLGIIALAPAILIIYAVIFASIGGIITVVIYNLIKFIKRKRTKNAASGVLDKKFRK